MERPLHSLADLELREFEAALTPMDVRGLQILHFAFAMGPVLFLGVVAGLHFSGSLGANAAGGGADILPILALALAAVCLGCYAVAAIATAASFSDQRLAVEPREGEDIQARAAGECVSRIRGALLLRAALVEGPALFGIVIILLASIFGELERQPLYWLAALPAAILLLYIAANFPTADRLKRFFVRRIKKEFPDTYRGD